MDSGSKTRESHPFTIVFGDSKLWGIVTLIALAIAFSRRASNSDLAVWLFLLIAAVGIVLTVNTLDRVRAGEYRRLLTGISALIALSALFVFGLWLTPAPEVNIDIQGASWGVYDDGTTGCHVVVVAHNSGSPVTIKRWKLTVNIQERGLLSLGQATTHGTRRLTGGADW
jgi:hypothetical protein